MTEFYKKEIFDHLEDYEKVRLGQVVNNIPDDVAKFFRDYDKDADGTVTEAEIYLHFKKLKDFSLTHFN